MGQRWREVLLFANVQISGYIWGMQELLQEIPASS